MGPNSPPGDAEQPLALRSVERTLAGRYSAYLDEVQRLIRAGVAVMEREQTVNPKVSDIVREARLSNQAFYKHFRGKSELLLAILDDGQRQLEAYLLHQMDKDDTGLGKIRIWVDGMISQVVVPAAASATRGVLLNSLELRLEFPEEWKRLHERLTQTLVGAVELSCQQGSIGSTDPEMAAATILQLVVSWMETRLLSRLVPTGAEIEFLESFVLHGLRASP